MTDNLPLSLIQLALAVMCSALAWSSFFAVTAGLRYHASSSRNRDLTLASANLAAFVGMAAVLLVDDLIFGLVAAAPFVLALAVLIFRFESPQAERRIAVSVRAARHRLSS